MDWLFLLFNDQQYLPNNLIDSKMVLQTIAGSLFHWLFFFNSSFVVFVLSNHTIKTLKCPSEDFLMRTLYNCICHCWYNKK